MLHIDQVENLVVEALLLIPGMDNTSDVAEVVAYNKVAVQYASIQDAIVGMKTPSILVYHGGIDVSESENPRHAINIVSRLFQTNLDDHDIHAYNFFDVLWNESPVTDPEQDLGFIDLPLHAKLLPPAVSGPTPTYIRRQSGDAQVPDYWETVVYYEDQG